jgi:ankyrin repeat protein
LDEGKSGAYIDINAKGLDDWTALHFASNEANIAVVKILCARGANIEAITRNKRTALHLASQRGSLDVT